MHYVKKILLYWYYFTFVFKLKLKFKGTIKGKDFQINAKIFFFNFRIQSILLYSWTWWVWGCATCQLSSSGRHLSYGKRRRAAAAANFLVPGDEWAVKKQEAAAAANVQVPIHEEVSAVAKVADVPVKPVAKPA